MSRPESLPPYHLCSYGKQAPHKWEHEHTIQCEKQVLKDCPTCIFYGKPSFIPTNKPR